MVMSDDEAALIALAKRGNLAAFNHLVLAHQARVYNLLAHTEGDPGRAEALTQQAVLSAFRRLADYRGGSFRAWLVRIAWNECWRAPRRGEPLPTGVPFAQSSGESEVLRSLALLPVEERWLLILADSEGFDYGEIASIADISEREVAHRLAAARLHLARTLSQGTCSQPGTP